jgi:hypothetical protein
VCETDYSALLMDGLSGFEGRHARGDRSLDKERDQVARRRSHLLADDDRQLVGCAVARAQSAVDPIVVGDREMRQPALSRGARDLLRLGQRIERR